MKHLNIILLIVVVGATIGLFFLLGPETKTSLFYINMGLICFLELVFFGTVATVSKKRLFNIPNLAVASLVNKYVIYTVIIVLVYNLGLKEYLDVAVHWYFGALIIVTLIFAIYISFTLQGAEVQKVNSEKMKETIIAREQVRATYNQLKSIYSTAIIGKDFDYSLSELCKNSIRTLDDKASMIPLAKLERNPEYVENLNTRINDLESVINNFDSLTEVEEVNNHIKIVTAKSKEIINHIDKTRPTLK